MSVTDSLLVGIFGMSVVFLVLIGLSLFLKLQAALVARFSAKKAGSPEPAGASESPTGRQKDAAEGTEPLRLHNVDEKTAAMIMAIVCDELHTQPEELQFKSIRAMDDNEGK